MQKTNQAAFYGLTVIEALFVLRAVAVPWGLTVLQELYYTYPSYPVIASFHRLLKRQIAKIILNAKRTQQLAKPWRRSSVIYTYSS